MGVPCAHATPRHIFTTLETVKAVFSLSAPPATQARPPSWFETIQVLAKKAMTKRGGMRVWIDECARKCTREETSKWEAVNVRWNEEFVVFFRLEILQIWGILEEVWKALRVLNGNVISFGNYRWKFYELWQFEKYSKLWEFRGGLLW